MTTYNISRTLRWFKSDTVNLMITGFLAASEAMVLGRSIGLDGERIFEAINASGGRNTATAQKFPAYVLPGTFEWDSPSN